MVAPLFTSSPVKADSLSKNPRNTLLYNGFNAASWGELGIDTGTMDELNLFALRISAGVQLLRYKDTVSLTTGYMVSGFDGASYPQNFDDGKYRYVYSGVDISLILFPSATHSFGIKYVPATGESVVLEYGNDSIPVKYIVQVGDETLKRKNIYRLNEYSGMYTIVSQFWQLV